MRSQQAMRLASAITDTNMTLAQRGRVPAAFERLEADLRVTGYRRVVHPELSRTGTCGLCIVASDQVYNDVRADAVAQPVQVHRAAHHRGTRPRVWA
jgi:hypothetical protein